MAKTVLLVDDDPSWQFNYEEILSDEGYNVIIVGNKEDAMNTIAQDKFDIAIIDLRLVDSDPKNKDGIDVVATLRRVLPRIPIIVKSGYLDLDTKERLKTLEIDNKSILDKLDEQEQRQKLIVLLRTILDT